MQKKISIGSDRTWVAPAMTNVSHLIPTLPGVEMHVRMDHLAALNGPAGYHKLAVSVQHRNSAIVQHFHDCGRFIPHLTPYDAVLGTCQSSRQVRFSESSVLIQELPVGFAMFLDSPPTPMLTCGMIPLPIGDACSSANGVKVGLAWADYCAGVASTLLDIVVGTVLSFTMLIVGFLLPITVVISVVTTVGSLVASEALRLESPGQSLHESIQRIIRSGYDPAQVQEEAFHQFRRTLPVPPFVWDAL